MNLEINKQKPEFDLEERTYVFAQNVRSFVKLLPKTASNYEDIKQVVRSSGSIGANYIEANESLSKKDFVMRIKISRKEARESNYWLKPLDTSVDEEMDKTRKILAQEALELMKIFGSIYQKSK